MIPSPSNEIEHRILLGRILEHLTQMEQSVRVARELVQDAVSRIDRNRSVRPPTAREMIIRVLREEGAEGLSRVNCPQIRSR